eukprot:3175102-Alexandrium_andersonii.AAC.1
MREKLQEPLPRGYYPRTPPPPGTSGASGLSEAAAAPPEPPNGASGAPEAPFGGVRRRIARTGGASRGVLGRR